MSAVISDCGTFRYRLERDVQMDGLVFAYFGINGSTAGVVENDHTVRKWIGFTKLNGGRRFIVGNPFAYRAKDVSMLSAVVDPVGPDNARHLREIIRDADVLVPCWGRSDKVPKHLRHHLSDLLDLLLASGKPVKVFGLTMHGDPAHVLRLGYETALVAYEPRDARPAR